VTMTAPTHLLFDFFGTLVDYNASQTEQGFSRSYDLAVARGASLPYAEFLERLNGTWMDLEARAERSLVEYSMEAWSLEFLTRVLPVEPDTEMVGAFRDSYLDEWNKGVRYIPGIEAMLATLAERFVLVLITNTHSPELVHGHLRRLDIGRYFARVITSLEHGKRKPSACIFESALAQTGGVAGSAAYVGDSFGADYRGATGAGLRCLLIDPKRRHDVPEADRLNDIFEMSARVHG
jgi:putative hydrolase of the HAD superfamily